MGCCVGKWRAAVLGIGCAAACSCGGAATNIGVGDGVAMAGRIAFVSRPSSVNQIYLMDISALGVGSVPTKLTTDADQENYPSWSPDGMRLVYQRDFNGSAIYLIGADGTGQQRLSPTPGFDATPSWSPDGSRIVYARLRAAPQPNQPPMTDIRVMNADGTGDHAVLANTLFSVEPRWSVNDQLVFMSLMNSADLQIYVMSIDGTNLRRNADHLWIRSRGRKQAQHLCNESGRQSAGAVDPLRGALRSGRHELVQRWKEDHLRIRRQRNETVRPECPC